MGGRYLVIGILLVATLATAYGKVNAEAQTVLKFDPSGSDGWAPYYFKPELAPRRGIMPEVTRAILQRAGIDGIEVDYPPMRTNFYLLNGEIDFDFVNPKWIADTELRDRFIYSDPVIAINEYYIALESTDSSLFLNQLGTDKKALVGTIRGYYYFNEADIERVDFNSEKELLKALELGRVDVVIMGDLTARYWASQSNIEVKVVAEHTRGYLHIRMRKELAPLLNRLNHGIAQAKTERVIERAIASYINVD